MPNLTFGIGGWCILKQKQISKLDFQCKNVKKRQKRLLVLHREIKFSVKEAYSHSTNPSPKSSQCHKWWRIKPFTSLTKMATIWSPLSIRWFQFERVTTDCFTPDAPPDSHWAQTCSPRIMRLWHWPLIHYSPLKSNIHNEGVTFHFSTSQQLQHPTVLFKLLVDLFIWSLCVFLSVSRIASWALCDKHSYSHGLWCFNKTNCFSFTPI